MTGVLIVAEVFTVLIQKMVCSRLFRQKCKGKLFETAIWTSFFILFNVLTYAGFMSVYANTLAFLLFFLLMLIILYEGSIQKKILITLFMYLLGMGSEVLVYQGVNVIGIDVKDTMIEGSSRLLCVIISKLIWFTVVWVIILLWKEYQDVEVKSVDWIAAVFVPGSSIFIVVAIMDLQDRNEWIKLFATCIVIAINFFTFYLYERIRENALSQAEREYIQKQADYYAKVNEEMANYWFEMRSLKHDLKQRYLLEQSYLQAGNYERLQRCYHDTLDMLKKNEVVATTGNSCIDNIINYKALIARKKEIEMRADLRVAFDVNLDEMDICSLLGNLLDNAIEATELVEDEAKIIKIKIRMSGKNLLITTENPYSTPRKKQEDKYISTKSNKSGHGFGLKIIDRIVNKYNGEMVISTENNKFKIKVLLYEIA